MICRVIHSLSILCKGGNAMSQFQPPFSPLSDQSGQPIDNTGYRQWQQQQYPPQPETYYPPQQPFPQPQPLPHYSQWQQPQPHQNLPPKAQKSSGKIALWLPIGI